MNILIVFYSETGNTSSLAQAVAKGAEDQGAAVRLRRVKSLEDHISENRPDLNLVKESLKNISYASHEDLKWADGIAFGTPTRFGNMCTELKAFLDGLTDLWFSGELSWKAACVFTSTANKGGAESTLLSTMIPLFHLGFVVLGLPFAEQQNATLDMRHMGSPYGVAGVSGQLPIQSYVTHMQPPREELELGAALGRRLAVVAGKLSHKHIRRAIA